MERNYLKGNIYHGLRWQEREWVFSPFCISTFFYALRGSGYFLNHGINEKLMSNFIVQRLQVITNQSHRSTLASLRMGQPDIMCLLGTCNVKYLAPPLCTTEMSLSSRRVKVESNQAFRPNFVFTGNTEAKGTSSIPSQRHKTAKPGIWDIV